MSRDRDAFGFVELLASPQERAPKFLKARKEDKAQAQKSSTSQAPKGYKSLVLEGGKVNSPKSRKSKVLPSPKRLSLSKSKEKSKRRGQSSIPLCQRT